jgi:two-component sensor histidine kinase
MVVHMGPRGAVRYFAAKNRSRGSRVRLRPCSLGLIVTELVINALKHAFNADTKDGQITVSYEVSGTDWKHSVADNGVGKPDGVFAQPKSRLGTGIVKALAKQLESQVVTLSGPKGTTVSITHATFAGREVPNQPVAA